jgi:sugar O-acyltransferase (sialic acid O-acetyltransferase NeuD family)
VSGAATRRLVILGAESLGREAADIGGAIGYASIEFLDDSPALANQQVLGCRVSGGFTSAFAMADAATDFFVALGSAAPRAAWMRQIRDAGGRLATLVHPGAYVSASARVGANTMVSFGCHVASNVEIGDGNVLWSGVVVSHDCTIGDHCFFGPTAAMGGYTHIGDRSMFGCGAKLRSCITIGNGVMVGMGAIVVRSIPDHHVILPGSDPAPLRDKTAEEIYFGAVRTLPRGQRSAAPGSE